MTNLFGGSPRSNTANPPATTLRIQTSVAGTPIPIGWGTSRLAPNILWFNDFFSITVQQSSGGGKGVGGGNSGKGGGGQTQTYYQWNIILGLCEGPVSGVGRIFVDKNIQSTSDYGMRFYTGSYTQVADGAVGTFHPDQARAYRGISYLINYPFGNSTSPEMPAMNVEVTFGSLASLPSGNQDANARDVVVDVLTNTHYGVDFPSGRIGDTNLSTLWNYGQAVGIWVSPVLIRQTPLASFLQDLMEAAVVEPVWSGGKLKVVPYYDASASANGGTYTPNTTPVYDLTDDDFILAGNSYNAPVIVKRKNNNDRYNAVSVGYSSRANNYNPAVVEAKDDAHIQAFGLKKKDPKQLDLFCNDGSAQVSCQLQLGREQVMNTYEFTLPAKYVLLEPMDCVTLTSGTLLTRQLVRLKEITENDDYTLSMVAEDCLIGASSPPAYGQQANAGFVQNYNVDPGVTLTPLFFEPPDQVAGGLELWMAVTPVNLNTWGGCNVHVSYDGLNYAFIGQQFGPSRMGVLTAPLATAPAATNGPTIDTTSTLSVDLTESDSQLLTATLDDMLGNATLCFVNSGEFLSYENAVSTGANAYNLTTLSRGVLASPIAAAAAGATFVRCDQGVFRIPFSADRIGKTLYVKLVNFNHYGAGPQTIAGVAPYTVTITGNALTAALPSVTSFTSVYQSGITELSWVEISDFRLPHYEIRKGSSWASGSKIGEFAHPPVPAIGDGTYWLNTVAHPVDGLTVYGFTPISLTLSGSVLPLNAKASWDEQALGFPGSLSGSVVYDGTFVRTTGTGDLLGTADIFDVSTAGSGAVTITIATPAVFAWTGHGRAIGDQIAIASTGALPSPLVPLQAYFVQSIVDADNFTLATTAGGAAIATTGTQSGSHKAYAFGDILNYGGQGDGFYEIPVVHQVDVGYVAPCLVAITFASSGVAVSQNFFAYNPLFGVTDFFGSLSNQFVDVHPEIALSLDGITFGAWQDYQAGVYNARKFKARMVVDSNDAATIAFLTQFVFTVYVPTRVDNWALIGGVRTSLNNLSLLASGATLTFLPDTQPSAAPFNGGVSNPTQPSVVVTILNSQPGDIVVVTSVTVAGCAVQVQNAGVGVARKVNIRPEGF